MIQTVILVVLVLILLSIGAVFTVCLLTIKRLRRTLTVFVTPAKEGLASPFAELVSSIGATIGGQVAMQAKTTIMGMMSGVGKQAARLQGELLEEEQPGLGGLLKSLPGGMGKMVVKNPILQAIVGQLVGKMMGGQKSNGQHELPAGGSAPPTESFKL
jgi:hypothetical protein